MKILMVDDDPAILHLFQRVTKSLGFEDVESASSGDDAVSKVIGTHYDLITLDIQMPGASGLDVLSVIRNMCPHAIIAIISAHIPHDVPSEIAGCADVMITKPIAMSIFTQLVTNVGGIVKHMDAIRSLSVARTSVR